jgi:hypothetical protein
MDFEFSNFRKDTKLKVKGLLQKAHVNRCNNVYRKKYLDFVLKAKAKIP